MRPFVVTDEPIALALGVPLRAWSAVVASITAIGLVAIGLAPRWRTVRALCPVPVRSPRRSALTDAELIAFLDALARAVRSGASMHAALDSAAQHDHRLVELIQRGPPATPGQQLVCQAVRMAQEMGGQVGAIFDGAAAVLRERQAIHGEARAHSAQARLSAGVLTWLPIGFAAVIALGERGRAALASPVGLTCVAVGATLNGLGWLWMRRLIGSAQR